MARQVMTVAIKCDQKCPTSMPDTCAECPLLSNAKMGVVEVLADQRNDDEAPPPMDRFGKPIEDSDGKLCAV